MTAQRLNRDRLDEIQERIDRYYDELDTIERSYGADPASMPEGKATRWRDTNTALTRAREEYESIERAIRDREERLELVRAHAAAGYVEAGDSTRPIGGRGPYFNRRQDPFEGDPVRAPRQEVISRAMSVLDREKRIELSDDSKAQVERYIHRSGSQEEEGEFQLDGSYLARRILLTENDAYRSAFRKYVASSGQAPYTPEEQAAVARYHDYEIRRALGEVTPSAGGVGVPVLIDPTVILTSGAADVPLLRYCRIETVTNNLWKGVSSAGMVWSYTTESTESTGASPTLAQPTVAVHTARGWLPYSVEVGMDYPGFANEMGTLLNSGYNDLLAEKTMRGTGTDEPFGLFTALAAVGASQVTLTSDGVFQGQDIFKVWNALPERFRTNATWVMSTHVQSAIRQFAATQSSTSAYFTIDLSGGVFRLNERPVVLTDYAPTFAVGVPGTTGAANVLTVGDFRQSYLWVNRLGMVIEAVPHTFGANGHPKAERGFLALARNGGNVVAANGGRILLNT